MRYFTVPASTNPHIICDTYNEHEAISESLSDSFATKNTVLGLSLRASTAFDLAATLQQHESSV